MRRMRRNREDCGKLWSSLNLTVGLLFVLNIYMAFVSLVLYLNYNSNLLDILPRQTILVRVNSKYKILIELLIKQCSCEHSLHMVLC